MRELRDLSKITDNVVILVEADAIGPLIKRLEADTSEEQAVAGNALCNLWCSSAGRAAVANAYAIDPLVQLLALTAGTSKVRAQRGLCHREKSRVHALTPGPGLTAVPNLACSGSLLCSLLGFCFV